MDEIDQAERRVWQGERGSMTIIRVPPRLGVLVPEGRAGDEAVELWQANFEWILTDDTLLFFDAGELRFAGPRFTSIGTSLCVKARARLAEFHVLVSNAMIEMLAKTVNLSLGGFMRIYRKREDYEAQLRQALDLQRQT
jgi:hypothetical protein